MVAWSGRRRCRSVAPDESAGLWRRTSLLSCDVRNGLLLVRLEGVADRSAAEAMAGVLVGVPQTELPATAAGEYYWAELVGLQVINTREQSLGRVVGLIDTPANAVLRVADDSHAERLLPFVAAVVLEVDLERRCLRVEWVPARRVGGRLVIPSGGAPGGRPFVVDVVSLFPEMFRALADAGVTRRALATGRWNLQLWNPRVVESA